MDRWAAGIHWVLLTALTSALFPLSCCFSPPAPEASWLATAALAAANPDAEGFRQTPTSVQAALSSSQHLDCVFRHQRRAVVSWHFCQTAEPCCKSSEALSAGKIWNKSLENQTWAAEAEDHISLAVNSTWSRLTLRNVSSNHSGWYFCHVTQEIPTLQEHCGYGTRLWIVKSNTSAARAGWGVWAAVGAGSAVFIALAVCIGAVLVRKRHRSVENPIYLNMHQPRSKAVKQPSPRPGMSSDNSKGSSPKPQWTPKPSRSHQQSSIYENLHHGRRAVI